MDQIILGGILLLLAIPFYMGIKRIVGMFSKKSGTCGCGSSQCGCSKGGSCSSHKD